MVRYTESSLNRRFVKPREFIKDFLIRIQRTRHLVRYTEKFVISGVKADFRSWQKLLATIFFQKKSVK